MKVLFAANDSEFFYNLRFEIAQKVRAAGHEVIVVAEPKGYEEEYARNDLRFLGVKIPRRGTNPFADFRLFLAYRSLLRQERPDIIFTNSIKPNVYMGLAASLLHIPYVSNITGLGTSIEGGGLLSKLTLFLYKRGIKHAQTIFLQNKANKQFLEKRKVLPKQADIVMLPGSGVNLVRHALEPYPSEEAGIRLLFVGRIMKAKGICELLASAEKLHAKYPYVAVDIVGAYDDISLEPLVKHAEDCGAIRYHGRSTDVHSFMKNAHALVLPSYHEGLANVLLEAAATGRAVLASDIPGCRETFTEGVSGISFLPQNTDSLTEAIECFLALPHEAKEKMGQNGRAYVEEHFDRETVVHKYFDEISKIERR